MNVEDAELLANLAVDGILVRNARSEIVTILVRQLPEGVWLSTSDDLPGLIVETSTRDEAIDVVREVAFDLMELDGLSPDRRHQRFAFIYTSG